jgi:uncharacterized protein (TIGR02996 family)
MPADYDRQQRALLDAVWDDYDNDAPRLAYADWLDSIGDPADSARAEHVRLSVQFPERKYHEPASRAAFARLSELEKKYRSAWLAGLPNGLDARQPIVRRGMFELALYAAPAELLADGERNFRRSPPDVAFQIVFRLVSAKKPEADRQTDWAALFARPWWDRVISLTCQPRGLGPAEVGMIAGNPAFRRLRDLSLQGCRVGDEGVEALVASPHLGQLRTLNLTASALTGRGAVAVAARPRMPKLKILYLSGNAGIDDAGWAEVRAAVGTAVRVIGDPDTQPNDDIPF